MNQGKLDLVKQKMARVNIDILGISELKWMGVGKFNSDDHYIYYCGQESHGRNGVALIVNKRVWNAVLECNLKNDRMISVCFQGKPFNITLIQVYAPYYWCWRSWSWSVLWRPRRSPRTYTKKDVLFIIGDQDAKVRSQEIPGVTGKVGLGVQNEAEQRLNEICQENPLVIASTFFQQHKRQLDTWRSPNGQYGNQIDYIFCTQRWEAVYSQQK